NGGNIGGRHLADATGPFSPPVDPAADKGWQQTSFDGMQLEIRVLPFLPQGDADPEERAPSRMVIIRDRTRIRTLEKNLAEAEKLAAIGSLAAGVAHEIRNPLSALRGFAQYFAKKLSGKQPEEEYARTMVRESDRLNRVITDLLYLARPRDLAPVATDLTGVCEEITSLLRFELREQGLALACSLEATVVTADPDALKQALLNLLLNALEAMKGARGADGRTISLSSARAAENGRAGTRITVSDSGPGMTEEERAQACKPFFTTKKKGTGLGLALVQTIMQGHGGSLAITSPVPSGGGRGCAVSLFFPDSLPEKHTDKPSVA
ncbi:MAG: PAS domain-containing sensor histidine kinase, partial [Deltaproteobacteria bacterium]|nr:PAS domain-containing sensor histidine kinase [Deltaproteobacteria bacterium]